MPTEPFTAAPLRKVDFAMADSRLEWTFRGVDGSLLTRLETAHERPLHLMAISEDLQEFAHVHPALTDHGTFAIEHRFPKPGKYFLYADFIAPGGAPRVERSVVTIVEHTKVPKLQEWNVIMKAPPDLRAGRDAELRFEMPATDLDPYLGAWAHFAIVDSKHRVFIHAHPQEVSGAVHDHAKPMGPSPVSMIVPVHFPEVGEYKVWAQFQWRGEVRVVPFSLQVREAATVGVAPEIPRDAIRVDIASEGFSPARIVSSAASVKLAFVRSAASPNCGGKVVFPDLKLEGALRPGGSWVVEVPLTAGGEIRFSCGMGMYRGAIVSRVIQ